MQIRVALAAIHDGQKMHLHAGTPEQVTLWLFQYTVQHWHERFSGAKPSLAIAATELERVKFINEYFSAQPNLSTTPTYTVTIQTLPLTVSVAQ